MEPNAFAATQFALTPSILLPDISLAVTVYPTIDITFNFEQSLIPKHEPENLAKICRTRGTRIALSNVQKLQRTSENTALLVP